MSLSDADAADAAASPPSMPSSPDAAHLPCKKRYREEVGAAATSLSLLAPTPYPSPTTSPLPPPAHPLARAEAKHRGLRFSDLCRLGILPLGTRLRYRSAGTDFFGTAVFAHGLYCIESDRVVNGGARSLRPGTACRLYHRPGLWCQDAWRGATARPADARTQFGGYREVYTTTSAPSGGQETCELSLAALRTKHEGETAISAAAALSTTTSTTNTNITPSPNENTPKHANYVTEKRRRLLMDTPPLSEIK